MCLLRPQILSHSEHWIFDANLLNADLQVVNTIRADSLVADHIKEILSDPLKKAQLLFLSPIVQKFEGLNKMFQTSNDPSKAYEELNHYYRALKVRVLRPDGTRLPLQVCIFGKGIS